MESKKSETKQRMSLYLKPSLKKELEELAASENRTISNMVEVLIIEAVSQNKKAHAS